MPALCPRCRANITVTPDELGTLTCPQCGVRLRPAATSASPPADSKSGRPAPDSMSGALDALRTEVEALRRGQEQILQALTEVLWVLRPRATEESPSPASDGSADPPIATSESRSSSVVPQVRARRRQKTVLVVDDDAESCAQVLAALTSSQVPGRSASDGKAALAAIAAEKPDILVLEVDLSGAVPGRDLINIVKATMEWVDMSIVLHTRIQIEDHADVRTLYSADEFVAKAPESAKAVAAQVVRIFQRS